MATVRYLGPTGNANRDVGRETGDGDLLEHGTVYDVSEALAARLVASGAGWVNAGEGETAGAVNGADGLDDEEEDDA